MTAGDGLIHGPELDAALEVAAETTIDKLPICQQAIGSRLATLYARDAAAQCRQEIEQQIRAERPDLNDAAVEVIREESYDRGNFTLGLSLGWELALRAVVDGGPKGPSDA